MFFRILLFYLRPPDLPLLAGAELLDGEEDLIAGAELLLGDGDLKPDDRLDRLVGLFVLTGDFGVGLLLTLLFTGDCLREGCVLGVTLTLFDC